MKTYPAPWALTVWLYYADKKLFGFLPYSKKGIVYGIISACTFVSLSWLSYSLYQEEFLEHAHLHHLSRQDTRHNFSVRKEKFQQLFPRKFRFGFCPFISWTETRHMDFCAFSSNSLYAFSFRSSSPATPSSPHSYRRLCSLHSTKLLRPNTLFGTYRCYLSLSKI